MTFRHWSRVTHSLLQNRPVVDQHHTYSTEQVEEVLRCAVDAIIETLASGGEFYVQEIGGLVVENRRQRQVASGLTGQRYTVPPRLAVRFRPSSLLLDAVRRANTHQPEDPPSFQNS